VDFDLYSTIKVLHIVSATVLFGTGLGIAFFFWSSRKADDDARLFAARTTVRADLYFTLPAVILQPLTGFSLLATDGMDPTDKWLVVSYVLFVLAGACWLPVTYIQYRMMRMLEAKIAGADFDGAAFKRLRKTWFWLGWPAFGGLLIVFHMMVAKPSW
jgi:uncharacterized membrane protein